MTVAPTPATAELLALKSRLENANPQYYGGSTRIAILPEDHGTVVALVEAAIAGKPADEVRELKQRIHNLRVTLSSVVTLAETAPVNLKTQNAIAKAAKLSLDRDASASTTGEPTDAAAPVRGDREAIADEAMHKIWKEWFEFYQRHFRAPNVRISMADQMAFYEIAQPILRGLSLPVQPGAGEQEAVIEECAKVAESYPQRKHFGAQVVELTASRIAERIRALSRQAPHSGDGGGR